MPQLKCSQTHARAVSEVSEHLESLGHKLVHVPIPELEEIYFFLLQMLLGDDNMGIFEALRQGEKHIEEYNLILLISKIPWLVKRIIIWVALGLFS